MELIDVEELIEAHYKACEEDKEKTFESWSLRLMLNAPTIDPVKHGRWVGNGTKRCSVCGVYEDFVSAYCPNCGARMDGDDNEID